MDDKSIYTDAISGGERLIKYSFKSKTNFLSSYQTCWVITHIHTPCGWPTHLGKKSNKPHCLRGHDLLKSQRSPSAWSLSTIVKHLDKERGQAIFTLAQVRLKSWLSIRELLTTRCSGGTCPLCMPAI